MDRSQLARLTQDAISFALLRDADRTSQAISEICQSGDPFDMYAACCGFAEIAKRAMTKLFGKAPDLAAGDMWALEDLKPDAPDKDPARTFAVRFLIAYANDGKDTAPALYRTALEAGPEQFVDSVCALLADAADLHRLSTEQQPT